MTISIYSQKCDISTFHRMLILNQKNEILVVKFKNKNLWVTPGVYQNNSQTIKQGLDSIASTYGIEISSFELRGIYGLKSTSKKEFFIRNMFVLKTTNRITKMPGNIDKVEWISIKELASIISFPHISVFISDVFKFPNAIRTGTIERINRTEFKIIEPFYNLKVNK